MLPRMMLGVLSSLVLLSVAAAQTEPAPLTPPDYRTSNSHDPREPASPAQPLPSEPLPHYHGLPPQPVTLPDPFDASPRWQYVEPQGAPRSGAASDADESGEGLGEVSRHLRKAAEHLEAAGAKDRAAALREEALRLDLCSRLQKKMAEVKALEEAVDRLRPPTVRLEVKIGVLDRSQLRKALADSDAGVRRLIPELGPQRSDGKLLVSLEDAADVEKIVAKLEETKSLSVLSRPQMVTLSGTMASCYIGNRVSADGLSGVGIGMGIAPTLVGKSGIEMELQVQSGLGEEFIVSKPDDRPGTQRFAARFKVPEGKAAVVTWRSALDPATIDSQAKPALEGQRDLVIVIKPTRYEESVAEPAPKTPAAEQAERPWWDRWYRK